MGRCMSDMNHILGLGQDVFFEGKLYRIADDLEFGVQADFERWLKSQAMREAQEVASGNPEMQERFCRLFIADSIAGAYRLDGQIAKQALVNNPDASVKLLYLLLEDGKRKAPQDQQHSISEQLARKMLKDEKVGPWVQALCLVALGLDPSNALVLAMGLVGTRAETKANQQKQATTTSMKDELKARLSESSSENILPSLVTYLDSVGGG